MSLGPRSARLRTGGRVPLFPVLHTSGDGVPHIPVAGCLAAASTPATLRQPLGVSGLPCAVLAHQQRRLAVEHQRMHNAIECAPVEDLQTMQSIAGQRHIGRRDRFF